MRAADWLLVVGLILALTSNVVIATVAGVVMMTTGAVLLIRSEYRSGSVFRED